MNKNSSVAIVGGGIVGCAIAYELSRNGHKNIIVIDQNAEIPGLNQSSTNEGTIHSGIYYPKDIMPLKAALCVAGNSLMYIFCQKYNLPYKKVGKLIIATNKKEEEYLNFFEQVGTENGIKGIKKISGKKALSMEPNLTNITCALYVPSAGSASPLALIKKIRSLAEENGVRFLLGTKVTKITSSKNRFSINLKTKSGNTTIQAEKVINSAGLYADIIAKTINPNATYKIDPIRGEFFKYNKSIRKDVWMSGIHVYLPPYCYTTHEGQIKIVDIPPTKLRQMLKVGTIVITAGVHLSPAFDESNNSYILKNTVTISPLKTTGIGKEDYISNLHPAIDYIKKIHYFFPHLKEQDLMPDHTGIMAALKGHRDFIIEKDKQFPSFINLIGMESPAWTSCFAIAKYTKTLIYSKTTHHLVD